MPRIVVVLVLGAVLATGQAAAQVPETKCDMGQYKPARLAHGLVTWQSCGWNPQDPPVYVNPFYIRGDFDGTGPLDVAVLVVEKATGKRGILVVQHPL